MRAIPNSTTEVASSLPGNRLVRISASQKLLFFIELLPPLGEQL
jgi:hypothetical protein